MRVKCHPATCVCRVALIAATLFLYARVTPLSSAVSRWFDSASDAGSLPEAGAALGYTGGHYAIDVHEIESGLRIDGKAVAVDVRALWHLAQEQVAGMAWEQAGVTLTQLVAVAPTDARAAYWLGLLLAFEDRAQAVAYLDQAAQSPDWSRQAIAVRDALALYGTLSRADAHANLGVTLVGLGEWAFAERTLVAALEANAINPTALAYLGYARDRQQRDGLPDLEEALAMSPNDPMIHYLLGQHWRLAGDRTRAHDAFYQAYLLDDRNPALAVEVALARQDLGDYAGAERWFTRAIDLDPDTVAWRRAFAAFYADTRFLLEIEGLAFIAAASAQYPRDADIAASLGWAYYRLHDTDRAYDALNRAMRLDASSARVRYYFGVVLEQRGDSGGAADSYWYVVDTHGSQSGFGILAARALERLGYVVAR